MKETSVIVIGDAGGGGVGRAINNWQRGSSSAGFALMIPLHRLGQVQQFQGNAMASEEEFDNTIFPEQEKVEVCILRQEQVRSIKAQQASASRERHSTNGNTLYVSQKRKISLNVLTWGQSQKVL